MQLIAIFIKIIRNFLASGNIAIVYLALFNLNKNSELYNYFYFLGFFLVLSFKCSSKYALFFIIIVKVCN